MHFNHFCVLIKKSWAYCRKCGNFSQTLKVRIWLDMQIKLQKCMLILKKDERFKSNQTHLAIQNALIELLDEKLFEKVQVQEIIEKALINRTTFLPLLFGRK